MLANDAAVLAKIVLLVFGLGFAGMLLQAAMTDHNRHDLISALPCKILSCQTTGTLTRATSTPTCRFVADGGMTICGKILELF